MRRSENTVETIIQKNVGRIVQEINYRKNVHWVANLIVTNI